MAENKPLTVLQRLDNHEKSLHAVQQNVDNAFSTLRSSVQSAMELLEAVVHTIEGGPAKVEEVLKSKRMERAVEKAEQEKKQIETLVAQGVLKISEAITSMSLLVGRIFDKDGNVTGAGRNQVEFSALNPEIKEKFLGQGPGFVFTTDAGEKFEVLEVYEINPPQNAVAPTAAPSVDNTPAPVAPVADTAPPPDVNTPPTGSWVS